MALKTSAALKPSSLIGANKFAYSSCSKKAYNTTECFNGHKYFFSKSTASFYLSIYTNLCFKTITIKHIFVEAMM